LRPLLVILILIRLVLLLLHLLVRDRGDLSESCRRQQDEEKG
jgi:hypothetical protein